MVINKTTFLWYALDFHFYRQVWINLLERQPHTLLVYNSSRVIPAQAGIHPANKMMYPVEEWIPACARMTQFA
ncbi:hypothetical protein [Legionella lansingensis]|uniref:Uncharacterized protein n=1 Tax=Legionella lansingensis TaxID=45067 RepID=A0A0W0VGK0_9GAMM|nr:hypothetical protein [Legionella lansingensis]KTD19284.1 hypothetical protein Llan_2136 [Legionella lansingensis]